MLNSFTSILCLWPVAGTLLLLTSCNGQPGNSAGATTTAEQPFVPADGTPVTSPGAAPVAQMAPATPPMSGALTPDSLHLISPGRAGRLRLGMTEAKLKKVVPTQLLRRTTYLDKGQPLPAYEMLDAQQPSAPATVLHFIGDSVGGFRLRRIRIYDPQYRTAEGIGVGSPFGAARQNLGLTKVRPTPAGFAAVSGQVQMAWVIDPKSLPEKHPEEMNSADIPPAARITGVLLYR
ncbi:hypothetical protein HMJ29_16760 [Hymenobacter taeanensis]|uniref:Uncharacterized protein n=1 Tax=Hymenobacter taeanensis TaxID=2735321 RepID=A0A6M6BK56_9BACT|nr:MULTISPECIES: hypothetical protein [Hymenobacter]QJX48476.1 hypothetical protein HMJ29_16760 [Hymenobacter taeanensis]UOQ82029.1 hypothetical protein MUN83_04370 [Hymenobacter sp. 5414T-23]